MDKHTFWGFFLIAVILIVFSLINRPSKEQLAKQQQVRDSIALAQQMEREAEAASRALQAQIEAEQANLQDNSPLAQEELKTQLEKVYGAFANAAIGENKQIVVENEVLRLTFQSKGGTIAKAELKDYTAYGDSVPLVLFADEESDMAFTLVTNNNRIISTRNLYFEPIVSNVNGNQVVAMMCNADSASTLGFVYEIMPNDYMIKFSICTQNMQNVLAQNINQLEMQWKQLIRQQERGRKFEERYAQLQFMYNGGDIDKLSESKDDREAASSRMKWIAYKDQYFSTVLIAEDCMTSAQMESKVMPRRSPYIKEYTTSANVSFDLNNDKNTDFRLYLGPNHYKTLKAYDKDVEKADRLQLKTLVPLGWKIVAWINMALVIPMFDLFTSWGLNIGLVILLMTFVIKLIILPFTFTSYRSSAKMRVLKPQLDAINEKYPAEKMQERQQATMALYSKAGVSPMSGCLPMLFQFPVLMAMFWFLPTAIELRGKSFLWADDLSAYDAIIQWNTDIWLIGDHISLFCLLMTVLNVLYSVLNMQTQAGGQEMKMMKWMMYLMPVMFFFIFNDYAAGLSYYYLVSLLFTILQTYIFRWSINDEKLLKQMEANAAKNGGKPKKSGFMARLEKMQREQERMMKEQAKKQQRR